MTTAVAPAAVTAPQSSGITYTDQQLEDLVAKLTTLRNEIVAGSHPRLKLPAPVGDQGRPQSEESEEGEVHASSLPGLSNGTSKSTNTSSTAFPHLAPSKIYTTSQNGYHAISTSTPTASGIDPVLLEKSDTLVNAEAEQKKLRDVQLRQHLEHALEGQGQQKKSMLRHRTFDEYALPEFQADGALKSAQELVKPIVIHSDVPANGGASSTDSFDENTFYSSQMNESTTTEEVAEPKPYRPTPRRLCRFFLDNKPCPYGEGCTFSHDPAMKQKVVGDGSQAVDIDSGNTEEGHNRSPPHLPAMKAKHVAHKHNMPNNAPISQQDRIAQLEAELRAIREGDQIQSQPQPSHAQDKTRAPQTHSVHSPRGVDEFGREISLRDRNAQESGEVQRQDRRDLTPPSTNYGRVIRNHITSPYAPQPARVSPLAVAKVPQISQVRSNQGQSSHTSRLSNVEVVSNGQSPNMPLQPLSNRKRRRGRESGEQRNVAARREASPEMRIKEEPVSPPPFQQARPRLAQQPSRPVYFDAITPQPRPQERVLYQPQNPERPASVYEVEERAPLGPPPRRIISRNGQQYIANDEPDLRRVVSERQMRVPMSPAPRYAPYPDSETRAVRAASQVYISPTGQRPPVQYRASVQPQAPTYTPQGRSPSPPVRQMQSSPFGPPSKGMAPPPQRIVIDQYGNRFSEPEQRHLSVAPVSRRALEPQFDQYGRRVMEAQVRHVSVAPISHHEMDSQYEQIAPRSMSVRRTFAPEDENIASQYLRRQISPVSAQYAEYTPRQRPMQLIEPVSAVPGGQDPYNGPRPGSRLVYQETPQTQEYRQMTVQREGTYRVQSVRPMQDRYEQTTRVQSVQPQPRIVQLGERQPISPQAQVLRQLSVRPDDGYGKPINFAAGGGPQYQIAPPEQNGGYAQEVQDDGMYEPRRMVQRM